MNVQYPPAAQLKVKYWSKEVCTGAITANRRETYAPEKSLSVLIEVLGLVVVLVLVITSVLTAHTQANRRQSRERPLSSIHYLFMRWQPDIPSRSLRWLSLLSDLPMTSTSALETLRHRHRTHSTVASMSSPSRQAQTWTPTDAVELYLSFLCQNWNIHFEWVAVSGVHHCAHWWTHLSVVLPG